MNLTEVATSGPVLLAVALSLAAGLVSFASPCVVPLVPGYLAYLAGLVGADAPAVTAEEVERQSAARRAGPASGTTAASGTTGTTATTATTGTRTRPPRRLRVAGAAALFVLGFTAVFVSYGVLFGRLGSLLFNHQRGLERILGVVVIVLGLAFLGLLPGTSRDLRIHRFPAAGLAGAPLLGVVFGLGWTPCIGPTLGAVQSLALSTAGAGRGATLSAAYCLGLGVPFVLVALGARWLVGALGVVRRHANLVTYVGGGLLVLLGVLLVTGLWGEMTIQLTSRVGQTGLGTSL